MGLCCFLSGFWVNFVICRNFCLVDIICKNSGFCGLFFFICLVKFFGICSGNSLCVKIVCLKLVGLSLRKVSNLIGLLKVLVKFVSYCGLVWMVWIEIDCIVINK